MKKDETFLKYYGKISETKKRNHRQTLNREGTIRTDFGAVSLFLFLVYAPNSCATDKNMIYLFHKLQKMEGEVFYERI